MSKYFVAIFLLILTSCKNDTSDNQQVKEGNESYTSDSKRKETNVLQKVAKAYGIEHWDKVEKIEFFFVVNPGENESVRKWTWKTKTNDVSLIQNGEETIFNRDNLSKETTKADMAFVNDTFWLLFPFHLVWDNVDYTYEQGVASPINKLETNKIIVQYPREGGYTPGDRYDVYIDDNYFIKEWSYYPSGREKPALSNTFEDLIEKNGLKFNVVHSNPETGFNLVLKGISVE